MSSGLIGGVIGAVAGFFIPGVGPMLGFSIGSTIGGYLDPPKGPHVEGPRLSDLTVQTSTYGAVIPRGYGTFPVVGNVFWLENNSLKEVATTTYYGGGGGGGKGGGGGGGGGGSTQTVYTYYATFAVGLCQGPIAGVRRIWVGADLIYDASANDVATLAASNASANGFTLHLGTDTQLADARMQATLGIANTPAYRGLAYIVFNDLALAHYGNTLMGAQVKVEVVSITNITTGARSISTSAVWNPERGISLLKYSNGALRGVGLSNTGGFYYMDQAVVQASGSVVITQSAKGPPVAAGFIPLLVPGHAGLVVALTAYSGSPMAWFNIDGAEFGSRKSMSNDPINDPTPGTYPAAVHAASDTFMCIGVSSGGIAYCCAAKVGTDYWVVALARTSMPVVFSSLFGNFDGNVYAQSGTTLLYSIDQNFTILDGPWTFTTGLIFKAREGKYFYFTDVSIGGNWKTVEAEFDGVSYTLTNYKNAGNGSAGNYLGYLGGRLLWTNVGTSFTYPGSKYFSFGDLPAGQTANLGAIVVAEMVQSGLLAAGDIDAASLTQAVRGYRIGSVSAIRSALEQLQGAWPFDIVQHGYQIKCVPRGGASVATVADGDLDARAADQAPGVAVTSMREMDPVLPRRVSLKFLDSDREYNDNEQYAERLNTTAVNVRSLDLAIVLTATEAAQIAERLLYLYWLERYDVSLRLPPTYNQIEPADVITVLATEGTYQLRLTKVTYTEDGRLECQSKYNSAAAYVTTAVGESGTAVSGTIALGGPAFFIPLDIPLLRDAADQAGFPVAMGGYSSAWSGGVLYQTTDGGQTWTVLRGFTAPGATIGVASAAIGAGRTDLIDKSSALTVKLNSGTLASVSDAALLNGANHFAYGAHGRWEIIAAKNCALQGDGSYILTDLLRGRAGTEWACGQHGAYDSLVALDTTALPFLSRSISDINAARTYRAVTVGQTLASVADYDWTYTGVNLECLSPVYLNGNRNPSTNDWSLDWIRRTRVGGEWRDYIDAPLSEASQAYEVDIFSNGTYTTLKRTLTGLATPAATYTSAQQVTDFGSNQATLYVKVYQISANVGRGYPLTTSITR